MLIGYARVSTTHQDLERQLVSLGEAGCERTFQDKRTGSTTKREGLEDALGYARPGDVIVVYTLDRLARNMRDTLNLIHDLTERGVGIRSLNDPIPVDTSSTDLMAKLSVMLLALFAEMERAWNLERVAHARSKAGRSPGRPRTLAPERVVVARRMQAGGESVRQIAKALQVPKTTLARALTVPEPAAVTARDTAIAVLDTGPHRPAQTVERVALPIAGTNPRYRATA